MIFRTQWIICLSFITVCLTACQDKNKSASDTFSLWGSWVIQDVEIKDEGGVFPASVKLQMEREAKGQVWQFKSDSTITVKGKASDKTSGTVPFSIAKRDGHTLLVIGESVTELMNMTANKMDVSISQGITVTMHMAKQ